MLSLSTFAQVPDGSIIPNFQSITLDSSVFDLYSHLDAGRPVFLDVSATWCAPCWSYHNGHAFKTVWDELGPDGTNQIGMLMIEGDEDTNINCLYGSAGCNDATQGDWVTGTPYPITDDTYVAQDILDIGYYPTIYLVCPDRTITEVGQVSATALKAAIGNCAIASGVNNASAFVLKSGVGTTELCGTLELSPVATVINLGTEVMTSATITLYYNGQMIESMDWTGTLNTYENVLAEFAALTIDEIGALTVEITNVNGGDDDDLTDNVNSIEFTAAPEADDQRLLVDIMTDQYGAEFYWEARMADGTVFASGGNATVGPNGGGQYANAPADPGSYANSTSIQETVVLPDAGCYSFHLVDSYGDGMCCQYGAGHFAVYNESDVALANPIFDTGEFAESETRGFGTSNTFTNIENLIEASDLVVFPNPTASNLNVRFELKNSAEVGIAITNALGQTVHRLAPNTMVAGQHTMMFGFDSLANGMYTITLQTEQGSITRKFTVLK